MARYKEYSYEQGKFIPIHFDKQILPGTFEYTLSYVIDDEIDLSLFDQRYKNDETGAPAYPNFVHSCGFKQQNLSYQYSDPCYFNRLHRQGMAVVSKY